ncbi:hypothetical protein CJD50_22780 [Hafnia paralvei]|uniref:Uncharacterized protein n=2 Tax=Hafnia paralvei TaxID=546367 RepID=A0A2A2M696_9GAMM|nr:hypothetical protein CJD50_22780 [Hafnia paralvei]
MLALPSNQDSKGANEMTEEEQTVLMAKGLIASLPKEKQQTAQQCIETIRSLLEAHPDGEALLALTLVGAELQCES